MPAAQAVARGCGRRVKGGVYAECGLSENGLPLELFMIDPPHPIDPEELGVTPIGVKLIKQDDVWHIFDWVGSTHYPNVADFIEEVRRFGMSRRLPKTLDFSLLTKSSRHILIHSRAWIENFESYLDEEMASKEPNSKFVQGCPRRTVHLPCSRYWWQDVEPECEDVSDRSFRRKMPSFEYSAHTRPEGVEPEYRPALFLSLPIQRLVVIRDEGDSHEAAVAAASQSQIRVEVEDE